MSKLIECIKCGYKYNATPNSKCPRCGNINNSCTGCTGNCLKCSTKNKKS